MNQPVYGQGPGYQSMVDIPSMSNNPWSSISAQANQMQPQYQQNLWSLMQRYQGIAGQEQPMAPQGYPTFPNAAGIGSQEPNSKQSVASTVTTTDRGFSPYSLQGEALTR